MSQKIPIEHKAFTLIDNFQSETDVITLNKHLSIMRISALPVDEAELFSGETYQQSVVRLTDGQPDRRQVFNVVVYKPGAPVQRTLERSDFVIRWHFKAHVQTPLKDHYDYLQYPTLQIETLLLTLRLMQPEVIGIFPSEHLYIQMPFSEVSPSGTDYRHDGYTLSNFSDVELYVLQADSVKLLNSLFQAVEKEKRPRMLTAFSRLDSQYSRTHIGDRLIDSVVALEALYGSDDMHSEATMRVALRASTHLGGNNPDEREHLFDLVSTAYNLRSRLVHGTSHTPKDIEKEINKKRKGLTSETFLVELNEILRQGLRSILLEIKEPQINVFQKQLDRAIRRGEPFLGAD